MLTVSLKRQSAGGKKAIHFGIIQKFELPFIPNTAVVLAEEAITTAEMAEKYFKRWIKQKSSVMITACNPIH